MFSIRLAATVFAASSLFGADLALLNFLPADAKVVGGINMTRAINSPLGQHLLSQMNPNDPGFREFVDTTGFDPRRDVREVVFAAATVPVKNQRGNGLMAARGVFNGPQIAAAAKAKGVAVNTYQGVDIVQSNGNAMAVAGGSLLLMGEEALVRSALDRRALSSAPPATVLPEAQALMNRYDVWLVTSTPVESISPAKPGTNGTDQARANAMRAISEIRGGARLDDVVHIEGEAVTRSAKDAQALIDVVRFLTGFATLNREANPKAQQFESILNSLEMKPVGNTVEFSAQIPAEQLEQMLTPRRGRDSKAARP